jgi:hypothetical protein
LRRSLFLCGPFGSLIAFARGDGSADGGQKDDIFDLRDRLGGHNRSRPRCAIMSASRQKRTRPLGKDKAAIYADAYQLPLYALAYQVHPDDAKARRQAAGAATGLRRVAA